MPQLQGAELEGVLSHLTVAEDLVRCSTVCTSWARALQNTPIKTLDMRQYGPTDLHSAAFDKETTAAQAQLRWLQDLHKQRRLKGLTEICLNPSPGGFDSQAVSPSVLSQGLVVLAAIWPLQKVVLRGAICLKTAVALLPKSLLILDLWPDTGPAIVSLGEFEQFNQLKVRFRQRRM